VSGLGVVAGVYGEVDQLVSCHTFSSLQENILKLRNKLGEAELEAAQDADRAREMNLEKRKEEVKAEVKVTK